MIQMYLKTKKIIFFVYPVYELIINNKSTNQEIINK